MNFMQKLVDEYIPRIDPDKIVLNVSERGVVRSLSEPMRGREIECIDCKKRNGYWNPGFNVWVCRNNECIRLAHELKMLEVKQMTGPYKQYTPAPYRHYMSAIPDQYENVSIHDLKKTFSTDQMQNLKEYCQSFAGFLVLAGAGGRGKTHAACAVLRYHALKVPQRSSEYFVSMPNLQQEWVAGARDGVSHHVLEKYVSKKLLVLDDFGFRKPSDAFEEFVFMLINQRSNYRDKGTIVTTNQDSQTLMQMYSAPTISRLFTGIILKMDGMNMRNG